MKDLRFITVEGVIGAGKTSLVEILAKRFHAGMKTCIPYSTLFLDVTVSSAKANIPN
jgi:deoxyadenosine/deoxycytidine kinase